MKTIKSILYTISLSLTALLFGACQDVVNNPQVEDFSSDGAPTISKITTVTDLEQGITQSAMGQWVALQGDNLANVTSIRFNDVAVNMKEIYAVRHRINVQVPSEAPSNQTNTLTITTPLGEVTVSFTIDFPPLKVNGLLNEFAMPGSDATVTGEYFKLYGLLGDDATFTLDGKPLTIKEKTDNKIVFTIPSDVPDGAAIVLNSPKLKAPITLSYRDKGVPLFASYDKSYLFDGGYLWTDRSYFSDGTQQGDPTPPIGTSFLRRKNVYSAWTWDTLIGGHFDLSAADSDVAQHTENYYLKFEVWTPNAHPLSTGDFIFWSKQSDDKMKLRWNPASENVSFNTNGTWQTITLEAQSFFRDNNGANTLQVGANDLTIVYQPKNDLDADFAIVNLRFVKKP